MLLSILLIGPTSSAMSILLNAVDVRCSIEDTPLAQNDGMTIDVALGDGRGGAERCDWQERQMENTIVRSKPCSDCGAEMLWTQNAWHADSEGRAAYRCLNGHVLDPSTTRQCPTCGVHDTTLVNDAEGQQEFRCCRCRGVFCVPR